MVYPKSILIGELKSQLRSININAQKHLKDVIESRNSETKSTAGDKHETSRAMVQREIDMLKHQLNNSISMENELDQIINA